MREKTSGIRLHIGVDVLGLPHAIMITTADVTDRNGAIKMINYYCDVTDNLTQIKKVLVDGGYMGQNFADEINSDLYKILLRWFLWRLSALSLEDTKQALRKCIN